MRHPLYIHWQYVADCDATVDVLPDGCRDVLHIQPVEADPLLLLTERDSAPRLVEIAAGTRIEGWRLRPGVDIDPQVLPELAARPEALTASLEHTLQVDDEREQLIAAFATRNDAPAAIARAAGVSLRTLQRQFLVWQLPPPLYWRQLGRARRAALAMRGSLPLAEIAADCGYSDQAHLCRECRRWFGLPPARLRRSAATLATLAQPGLSTWTGLQTSIR